MRVGVSQRVESEVIDSLTLAASSRDEPSAHECLNPEDPTYYVGSAFPSATSLTAETTVRCLNAE